MPERLAYDEALQFSAVRLKVQDLELKQGAVEMVEIPTARGLLERPWGIEGGFAVVYKFRRKSGSFCALRCFRVAMSPDMQFRYERLGPYFRTHAPGITVGFRYHNDALVVKEQGKGQNQPYPVIEMDWIDGVTLVEKVHELCLNRRTELLHDLALQWVSLLRALEQAHIAHGDLAGGNVMVQPDGRLVLIDYDGVYIPDFARRAPVLMGQEDFQHPYMQQRKFNERMDAFSGLVIYCALLVLSIQPELWEQHAQIGPDGKLLDTNLLFRRQDFLEPQRSDVFFKLDLLSDHYVRQIVAYLKQACSQSIDAVTFPFDLIDPQHQALQDFMQLERVAQGQDDEKLVASWTPALEKYEPAQQYRRRVERARQRIDALKIFRAALASGNLQRIVQEYDATQLDTLQSITVEERSLLALAKAFLEACEGKSTELPKLAEQLEQQHVSAPIVFTSQQKALIAESAQKAQVLQAFRETLHASVPDAQRVQAAYNPLVLDKSEEITAEERDLLKSSAEFLTMHSALQKAIQAEDDATIRATYDSTLAQRFAGITPQEQARIDLALFTETIDGLLQQRAYERAHVVAQDLQYKLGQRINAGLAFKLQRGLLRFLRDQALSELTLRIEEGIESNSATLSWRWPESQLIQYGLITWQSGEWPAFPSAQSWEDPNWYAFWVTRREHAQYGGQLFQVMKGVQIYVRAYAALEDIWEPQRAWRFSDGNQPTAYATASSPQPTR